MYIYAYTYSCSYVSLIDIHSYSYIYIPRLISIHTLCLIYVNTVRAYVCIYMRIQRDTHRYVYSPICM